jgi:hypothetical protein
MPPTVVRSANLSITHNSPVRSAGSTPAANLTPEFSGTAAPWKSGATPNSIYRQLTVDGRVKSIGYYDDAGRLFSREDYIQAARHRVTFESGTYDLSRFPHEHQTRALQGPNGPYLKNQVRILDQNGMPFPEWVDEAP